jgi:hypothetical protein
MLRQVEIIRDFTDRAESIRALVHHHTPNTNVAI